MPLIRLHDAKLVAQTVKNQIQRLHSGRFGSHSITNISILRALFMEHKILCNSKLSYCAVSHASVFLLI